ncbi:SusC/RagA family TonB-linked outer membrane protein [Flavobacteriaceae bacterium]|nr:SusC/RagA family TonB-linked outer membrane protein [Flavobacteriaceae bacterium]
MKTKFNVILTLLLVFVVQISFAQEKKVSGTVSDSEGLPLPGATVIVSGTNSGVSTDFDGNYSIIASTGDVLVFSYVGYTTQRMKIGENSMINVVLSADTSLDEVVVVAFGTKTRDELTSAVTVVTGEDLAKLSPTTSIDNMLQGIAPGVQVVAGNGKPGQTAFVRVRGIGSINASSAPLYIIDGVIAPDLNSVNPVDVESVSILKDAATSSLYGARAANGVVLIKTRSGKKNKEATVTLSSRYGVGQRVKDNFKMMNAAQKIQYERELSSLGVPGTAGLPGPSISTQADYDRLIGRDTDWFDTLLQQSVVQSNSMSIAGGGEKMSYFLSVGHDVNTGIIKTIAGFERMNARLNVTYDAKDWLEVSTNFSVSTTSSDEPRDRNNVQNPFRAMYDYNPYETKYVRDSDNNIVYDDLGDPEWNLTNNGYSISEALVNNPEDQYFTTLLGGITVKANLGEGLSNTFKIGAVNSRGRRESYLKPNSVLQGYVGDADNPGSKTDNGSSTLNYTVTNLVTYNKLIGEKHDFTLTGLFEFNKSTSRSYSLTSIGFSNPDFSVQSVAALPDATSTSLFENTILSYGAFLDYGYDSKLFVTASVRRDLSSVFGQNNKSGVFTSASAAYNIAKENWWNVDFVNDLKIRASAGSSGNRNGIGSYASLATLGFGSFNGQSTAIPSDNGNPDLGFEKNFIFDVGLEFTILNRKLSGVIDYYERTTSDLLLNAPLPSLGGEPDGSIFSNIGEMTNKGLELELKWNVVQNKDLTVSLGGNIAFIDNEVTQLVPSSESATGSDIIRGNNIIRVGEEINTFYLPRWAGINPSNGEPLFYDSDGNVTNVYDSDANVLMSGKSPIADFDGGINLYVAYKGFDLATDFYFKSGNYILNYMESNMLSDGTSADANQRVDAFNYWKNPGDTNVLPNPLFGNEAQQNSDRWLQKGDYIRLRNLTLGYSIPRDFISKTGIQSFRVYVQGQNLWTFAPYFNGDPEVGIGSGETSNNVGFGNYNLYSYPQTQSLSVGVDIKF